MISALFVSAQEKSQDSTTSKAQNKILIGCYGVEPLYVIDGLVQNSNNFKQLNTDDIVTISVLKGDQAISAYGNRGENGVIIVKTKNSLTKKEKRKQKREAKRLASGQLKKS